MAGYEEAAGGGSSSMATEDTDAAAAAPSDLPATDRVTLEIKGAKLNVAIQNALRRKRNHDRTPTQREGYHDGDGNQHANGNGSNSNNERQGSAGGRGQQQRQGACGGNPGSIKEAALLKAAVESLRAGLREKEDAVTELERDKEGLLDQVARVKSTTLENVKLGQQVADLRGQIERLESKLAQAAAGRALTMTLVDALKSAQNDLRAAHGQVSQRYADLENVFEDSAEAVRRGSVLLHGQQLKIDAQLRQIKRQEEDLVTLREERELQMAKADQNAAELALALRRERAGQGGIADAQAEVDELKVELDQMREAFAKHRSVIRKNQEVIDAQGKALKDARSELLSLSLEAEKQSTRHHTAAAEAASETARATEDKNQALRESRALRIEKEDLEDKLKEAGRKLDGVQSQLSKSAAAATAAATTTAAGTETRSDTNNPQQHASPSLKRASPSQAATPGRRPPELQSPPESLFDRSNTMEPLEVSNSPLQKQQQKQQQQRSKTPLTFSARDVSPGNTGHGTTTQRDDSSSLRRPYRPTTSEVGGEAPSGLLPPTTRPSAGSLFPNQEEVAAPFQDPLSNNRDSLSSNRDAFSSHSPLTGTAVVGQDSPPSPSTSAADAGGGGGASVSRVVGVRRGGGGGNSRTGGGGRGDIGGASRLIGSQKVEHAAAAVPDDGGPDDTSNGEQAGRWDQSDGSDGADSGTRGPRSWASRSRPRSPGATNDTSDGSVPAIGLFLRNSQDALGGRKRAKTGKTRGDSAATNAAGASAAGATAGGRNGGARGSPPPPLLSSPSTTGRQTHSALGNSDNPGEGVQGNDAHSTTDGVCPSCGDTPYGLMINCRSCPRQYHSSCVPEGQKVGKGLGSTAFSCPMCSNSTTSEK